MRMHLTLIFTAIIVSYSTVLSHPLTSDEYELRDELNNPTAPRPLAQFFKKIFSALRPKYSRATTELPQITRRPRPSQSVLEVHEIPNFVDFSTYLLDSFAGNNSAIKFSYLNPNTSSLRGGDYSVISFLVPHAMMARNATNNPSGGLLNNFLNFFRFPWRREQTPPKPGSDTVYQQFPQFLEYFAQRVQAYFSIYKFADESRFNNTIVFAAIEESHQNDELDAETTTQSDELETTEEESTEEAAVTTTELYEDTPH